MCCLLYCREWLPAKSLSDPVSLFSPFFMTEGVDAEEQVEDSVRNFKFYFQFFF